MVPVKHLLLAATAGNQPLCALLRRLFPVQDRTLQYDQLRWDKEYAAGEWSWLNSTNEAAHNYVIAGYCNCFRSGSAILDVGCGEGSLQSILRQFQYGRYVGIDISHVAIERALTRADPRTEFLVSDAQSYETEERFDVIVLNEVLYYSPDPMFLLGRLSRFLSINGIFIVSMAQTGFRHALLTQEIWQRIASTYRNLIEVSLHYRSGLPRIIRVFDCAT